MNVEELVESIVLCGGAAKRMKPYLPFSKAFAEVLPGVTLLEYQVKWLFNSGMNRVILAIDRETYTSLRAKEVSLLDRVTYSIEEERLGTGGAIKLAIEHVDSSSVYVMNVDDIILSKPMPLPSSWKPSRKIKTLKEAYFSRAPNFPSELWRCQATEFKGLSKSRGSITRYAQATTPSRKTE